MPMYGPLINAAGIVIGALMGLLVHRAVSQRLEERLEIAMGYCVLIIGIKMALKYDNILVVICCVAIGGILGSSFRLTERIGHVAKRVQRFFTTEHDNKFAAGLTTTSILYCTGAMAIVGAIHSGVLGDHEILVAKALIDGIISVTMAAVYGIGVAFSAIPVLLYEGALVLLASSVNVLEEPAVISDISGVGGVLLSMIGIHLTGIKQVPVGDFVPALLLVLFIAPLLSS